MFLGGVGLVGIRRGYAWEGEGGKGDQDVRMEEGAGRRELCVSWRVHTAPATVVKHYSSNASNSTALQLTFIPPASHLRLQPPPDPLPTPPFLTPLPLKCVPPPPAVWCPFSGYIAPIIDNSTPSSSNPASEAPLIGFWPFKWPVIIGQLTGFWGQQATVGTHTCGGSRTILPADLLEALG